jgi:hypothetical protein
VYAWLSTKYISKEFLEPLPKESAIKDIHLLGSYSADTFISCPHCNKTGTDDIIKSLNTDREMRDIFYNFGLEDELRRSLHGVGI